MSNIMDYEKKYKEALELMKDCIPDENGLVHIRPCDIFSELKKSEDEKIRKALIGGLKNCMYSEWHDGVSIKECIAWLEKQCEQKPADKVEPKFKVGDWIIDKQGMLRHIINVDEGGYQTDGGWLSHDTYEKTFHLWTIQDAKDGDVLADGNLPFIFKKIDANKYSYAYCGISVDDSFKIDSDGESGEWTWMQDIKPATNEQRDLLFQKMKDAGYEWDADKKELKKILQKHAWSEEQMKVLDEVIRNPHLSTAEYNGLIALKEQLKQL